MKRDSVITVEHLTARFGDNTILEDVSFNVVRGEVFVIIGGSGCGKSTLLKHMIGLHKPVAGRVLINGIDVHRASEEALRSVRMNMGVLFQSGGLLGSMDVAENIALPLTEYTSLSATAIDMMVKAKLGMVNLAGYGRHMPSELSGGMQKRAGLARAVALNPDILFFDEPSAGLDPVMSAELDNMIRDINEGMATTMVIVTHQLESIFTIAHRVIMLDKTARGIVAEGDPRILKENSRDERVFNFLNRRIDMTK